MTERIISLVGDNGKNVMMGTFHSIFARLIRPYAHLLGFGYNFTILDEEDAKTVLTKSRDRILDSNRPPKEEWTEELIGERTEALISLAYNEVWKV